MGSYENHIYVEESPITGAHGWYGNSQTDTTTMEPGPVFRVSPNELSFGSTASWKAIYGYPQPGAEQLIKGDFYDIFGAAYKTGCIGSERNPSIHARKKKNLTAAFSAKALAGQESIIQDCLDTFVGKLGPLSRKSGGQGINVVKWLEMTFFDVLGEMAFGEGFGCVQKGNVQCSAFMYSLRI